MERVYYFIYKNKKFLWLVSVLLIATLCIWLLSNSDFEQSGKKLWWDELISPLITLITTLFAINIAVFQRMQRWSEGLQNYLNVHFVYNGNVYGSFYECLIVGKEDIRNQSQSLGGSMFDDRLDLTANNQLRYLGKQLFDKEDLDQEPGHLWEYVMRLNAAPKIISKKEFTLKDELVKDYLNPYFLFTIDRNDNSTSPVKGVICELESEEDYYKIDGDHKKRPLYRYKDSYDYSLKNAGDHRITEKYPNKI